MSMPMSTPLHPLGLRAVEIANIIAIIIAIIIANIIAIIVEIAIIIAIIIAMIVEMATRTVIPPGSVVLAQAHPIEKLLAVRKKLPAELDSIAFRRCNLGLWRVKKPVIQQKV